MRAQPGLVPPLRPLRSLLLVHGAGSGPWIFDGWRDRFPGLEVHAADLQGGLVVARASMLNYRAVVAATANLLAPPRAVCGWSMGGLAAMMAAEAAGAERLVLLEPSAPLEVRGPREVELTEGTFDPEQLYGEFPAGVQARPESTLARGERKRGISVPSLPCPTLVVYGDEFTDERGQAVARAYGADELHLQGLDHWGLVLDASVPEAVAAWLGKTAACHPVVSNDDESRASPTVPPAT